MKYSFTVNFYNAGGVRVGMQYVNQTGAQVEALVTQYISDATITKLQFNAVQLNAQQAAALEVQAK